MYPCSPPLCPAPGLVSPPRLVRPLVVCLRGPLGELSGRCSVASVIKLSGAIFPGPIKLQAAVLQENASSHCSQPAACLLRGRPGSVLQLHTSAGRLLCANTRPNSRAPGRPSSTAVKQLTHPGKRGQGTPSAKFGWAQPGGASSRGQRTP